MKHFHFQSITSTNDYAKELLREHSEVVVTAEHQTQGRGRNNRVWEGDFGKNIYLSYGKIHDKEQSYQDLIAYQAIGCIAVIKSLRNLTQKPIFKLKYLNDIFALTAEGIQKKLSGVLIEHTFFGNVCKSSIIGIGINVGQNSFPNELNDIATSLALLNVQADLKNLSDEIVENIKSLSNLNSLEIILEWKNQLEIIGKKVKIIGLEDEWTVEDMTDEGKLLVENCISKQKKEIDDGDSVRYTIF